MRRWNSLILAIYYGICLRIVNGNVLSLKQKPFPALRLSDNYVTFPETNPKKSEFMQHSDSSDRTILTNEIASKPRDHIPDNGNHLSGNENWQKDADQDDLGNLHDGRHIVMKSGSSLSDQTESKNRRSPRSVGGENILTLNAPLRRQKRGFRSAVADRIAHGFGKRADGSNLHQAALSRLRDTLSQLLSIQPEDLDGIESALTLYDNLMEKLQKSNDRNDVLNADKETETLNEIYEKLVNELQGLPVDRSRSFQGNGYPSSRSFQGEGYPSRRFR